MYGEKTDRFLQRERIMADTKPERRWAGLSVRGKRYAEEWVFEDEEKNRMDEGMDASLINDGSTRKTDGPERAVAHALFPLQCGAVPAF